MLDEPTSGLDPIVRREFIQTVIGAYQGGDPGRRTVFVSTHLISEFEGLIDQFTIIDRGHNVLTMDADTARERYQRIYARYPTEPPVLDLPGCRLLRPRGREVEVLVDGINGNAADIIARLTAHSPETLTTEALSLEGSSWPRFSEQRRRVQASWRRPTSCCPSREQGIGRSRRVAGLPGVRRRRLIAGGRLRRRVMPMLPWDQFALGALSIGHEYGCALSVSSCHSRDVANISSWSRWVRCCCCC